jgi:hypothetical protein
MTIYEIYVDSPFTGVSNLTRTVTIKNHTDCSIIETFNVTDLFNGYIQIMFNSDKLSFVDTLDSVVCGTGTVSYVSGVDIFATCITSSVPLFYNTTEGPMIMLIGRGFTKFDTSLFDFNTLGFYGCTNCTCFIADTPVVTSKGIKHIQDITCNDKINGVEVHSLVTSLIPKDKKYFVNITKDSLGPNIPSQNTVCTIYHKIFTNNTWKQAKLLINGTTITQFSKPEDTLVYNILLKNNKWGTMFINNLCTETLHPDNEISKCYYNLKKQVVTS